MKFLYTIFAAILFFVLSEDLLALSLRVHNPHGSRYREEGTIESFKVIAKPMGNYIEYGVYMSLSAKGQYYNNDELLEIEFDFELPSGSILNDSWLWVDTVCVKADLIDVWTASKIYEGIVKRRRDPSLLIKESDTKYTMNIYPLPAKSSGEIKINFLVPITRNQDNKINVFSPLHWIKASMHTPEIAEMIFVENDKYSAPEFFDMDVKFEYKQTEYGTQPVFELTDELYMHQINSTLYYKEELEKGYSVNILDDGKESYYQLAVNIKELDLDLEGSKVLVLLDFEANKGIIKREQVLEDLKYALNSFLNYEDSFAVLGSNINYDQHSESWVDVNKGTIDSVFNTIYPEIMNTYSNLPWLLSMANKFLEENGDENAKILLLSNTDKYGQKDVAQSITNDYVKYSSNSAPIFICDYIQNNITRYIINSQYWNGNEYLYYNLAEISGGEQYTITQNMNLLSKMLERSLNDLFGDDFESQYHISLNNGFCYSQYRQESNFTRNNIKISEIGILRGEFPMEIEIYGFHNDELFFKNLLIYEVDIDEEVYDNKHIWNGLNIQKLEKEEKTNKNIKKIIDKSMDNRILSLYTAFLALEPGMNLDSLMGEEDNSGGATDIEDKEDLQNEVLQAYPNPITNNSTITVDLRNISTDYATLKLFNTSGEEIMKFNNLNSGQKTSFLWDASDNAGKQLESGVYLLVLDTGTKKHIFKIVIRR